MQAPLNNDHSLEKEKKKKWSKLITYSYTPWQWKIQIMGHMPSPYSAGKVVLVQPTAHISHRYESKQKIIYWIVNI